MQSAPCLVDLAIGSHLVAFVSYSWTLGQKGCDLHGLS